MQMKAKASVPAVSAIAAFASSASARALTPDIRKLYKRNILDSLGCAIAAMPGTPFAALRDQFAEYRSDGSCSLIGGGKTAPDQAAPTGGKTRCEARTPSRGHRKAGGDRKAAGARRWRLRGRHRRSPSAGRPSDRRPCHGRGEGVERSGVVIPSATRGSRRASFSISRAAAARRGSRTLRSDPSR